ncbi:tRNA (adenosine(37)-N6)-dimethylallyltransferase MiaA [Fusobacterium ulcerans]|uniref:tRNA dimethylallyltransferase n=1 Tax=Fusobacterium ulcerans TaxID=861 RepID=A0AAX2J887_9FUSO|nr:tRNA (adenosine(37)-N6)-dimethylallyltransferase MiaA [Fusobacterium ulcerans]AVQ28281.1 tRNA (adenosine(37)-N6)-dimethylallyltransferase MiaA [Fusobacterium ulcerans]EFS25749.1 tRNA dimethylallyltransferase [Fusobacterium ulcerans ATCC 49185]SQJ00078.1 tRNA dimethylallyltransferase [Fusobacterium ulcerans]
MLRGLVIAGPTGVGKTDLSIKMAKLLKADIISADSAQVYKGMDIGTAKITTEEMQGIKHYMLDIVEPVKKYNVGDFQKDVDNILKEKETKKKNIILTGGTGLYISSITDGLSSLPAGDPVLREELMKKDIEELYNELAAVDPQAALDIHKNNRRRVERALEVFKLTGEKFSVLAKKNIKGNNYSFLKVALERNRDVLYERINMRVDIMLEKGLSEEVRKLYEKYGDNLRKINIIGYTQLIDYFNNNCTFEEAVENIKRDSRRYAKRQFTWFKNDSSYTWYNLDEMSEEEIIDKITSELKL